MTECYIPLIRVLEDLLNDKMDFRIALSLTPSLLEMLADPLLKERFCRYIDSRIDLAEREVFRTRNEPDLSSLAGMYQRQFLEIKHSFEMIHGKDLITALRALAGTGNVELMTSAATHAAVVSCE